MARQVGEDYGDRREPGAWARAILGAAGAPEGTGMDGAAARAGGKRDGLAPAEEYWVRRAGELAGVGLMGPAWERRGDGVVYEVWRGLPWRLPAEAAGAVGVRLDFTLLHPGEVAGEFHRTAGHVHRGAGGRRFGEIYQVLSGFALFVLVRPLQGRWAVLAVEAEAGDTVVIPPPYGHFTVNPAAEPLLCANLIDRRCQGDYDAFRRWGVRCWVLRRGALRAEGACGEPAGGGGGTAGAAGGERRAAVRLVVEADPGSSVSVARVARGQRTPWVARGLPPLWQLPPWVGSRALAYLTVAGEDGTAWAAREGAAAALGAGEGAAAWAAGEGGSQKAAVPA